MLGMVLDGLWRDCCKRAIPLPVGGSEGPCPTDDLEVVNSIPQIDAISLAPTICDITDGDLVPTLVDSEDLTPTLLGDSNEELSPIITDADTEKDC